jgi:hypothetical protein
MALGLSTDVYANIGGLLSALFVFVVIAGSYFMFAQKMMIRSDYFIVLFILALALVAYLVVKVYYEMQFSTKVTV